MQEAGHPGGLPKLPKVQVLLALSRWAEIPAFCGDDRCFDFLQLKLRCHSFHFFAQGLTQSALNIALLPNKKPPTQTCAARKQYSLLCTDQVAYLSSPL